MNASFPLNNTVTTPTLISTGIRIPDLKKYRLKTIIGSPKSFDNVLSDMNLRDAWVELSTFHSVRLRSEPTQTMSNPNYYSPNSNHRQYVPPPTGPPPTYYNNYNNRMDEDRYHQASGNTYYQADPSSYHYRPAEMQYQSSGGNQRQPIYEGYQRSGYNQGRSDHF